MRWAAAGGELRPGHVGEAVGGQESPPPRPFTKSPPRFAEPPSGWGRPSTSHPLGCSAPAASRRWEEGQRRRRKQGREADLWGCRLALAGADGRIWRAEKDRGKWEHGRHSGSAMKRWELSVHVSSAFYRLGNAAGVISWGRNASFLSLSLLLIY